MAINAMVAIAAFVVVRIENLTLAVSGPQRRTQLRRMAKAPPAVAGPFDEPVK